MLRCLDSRSNSKSIPYNNPKYSVLSIHAEIIQYTVTKVPPKYNLSVFLYLFNINTQTKKKILKGEKKE